MPSYKEHTVFGIFLTLIFFQNPISLAIAVIGANLPDLDHDIKKNEVYKMIIFGLLISIILYIFDQPYLFGLIICLLGIIFYYSNHRGFTHSIFGIFILTILLSLIVIFGSFIIFSLDLLPLYYSHIIAVSFMILFLGMISLNKKLLLPFLLIFSLGMIFLSIDFNYLMIVCSFFLGFLSHLILDSFSPAGIKIFRPFSSKKVYKSFGISSIIVLGIIAILQFFQLFNFII